MRPTHAGEPPSTLTSVGRVGKKTDIDRKKANVAPHKLTNGLVHVMAVSVPRVA